MRRSLTIFFFFILTVSAHSQKRAARKLNARAIGIIRGDVGSFADYENAIFLLDRATTIDSNYYLAYGNKISFLTGLKKFDEALKAAGHMRRIRPDLPEPLTMTGLIYES